MTASITFNKDSKGNITSAIVKDALAFYCKIQKPSPIYEERTMHNPTQFEYTIDLLVNEDVADEWDEVFAKQPSKKMSAAIFKEKFKLEDESVLDDPNAKKFYLIKAKQAAQKKDGSQMHPKMRPRVAQVVDGKPVDITFSELVGNGSSVDVLLNINQNDFGTFSYLSRVKVNSLISYESGGSDKEEEAFLGGTMEIDERDEAPMAGGSGNQPDNGFDMEEEDDDDAPF